MTHAGSSATHARTSSGVDKHGDGSTKGACTDGKSTAVGMESNAPVRMRTTVGSSMGLTATGATDVNIVTSGGERMEYFHEVIRTHRASNTTILRGGSTYHRVDGDLDALAVNSVTPRSQHP